MKKIQFQALYLFTDNHKVQPFPQVPDNLYKCFRSLLVMILLNLLLLKQIGKRKTILHVYYLPPDLLQRYASEHLQGLTSSNSLTPSSRKSKWTPVTVTEMKAFIALVLNMGLIDLKTTGKPHWNLIYHFSATSCPVIEFNLSSPFFT